MDSLNVRKIEIIVKDLLSEFEKENSKLQVEYDDNVARILEIEENIHNYKENEDVDFQVFSPRKIDNQNEAKIEAMNREKENIEASNKSLYRQIKYYLDKKEKLNEILAVIEEDRQVQNQVVDSDYKEDIDDDITHVDEKILAYYDSIAGNDEEDVYPEEPESIGKEVKSGWRVIKDELESPFESLFNGESDEDLEESLKTISDKLEKESRLIEEDYFRTRAEIKEVLNSISGVLEKIKK